MIKLAGTEQPATIIMRRKCWDAGGGIGLVRFHPDIEANETQWRNHPGRYYLAESSCRLSSVTVAARNASFYDRCDPRLACLCA